MATSKTASKTAAITDVFKYGANWDSRLSPLQIELLCIRYGGEWTQTDGKTAGLGLFEHYMNARALLWPDRYRHRWSDRIYRTVLEHDATILMGSASSQKTSHVSELILIRYWSSPDNTMVLVTSVSKEKLEGGIFAEIKTRWSEAKKRYSWLAGKVIDYKQAITTDQVIEEDDVRIMRKGIFCKACFVGGKYVGLGTFAGSKQQNIWFVGDELQYMAPTFYDCLPNMQSNVPGEFRGVRFFGLKVIGMGNPNHDPETPLGIMAEPPDGWASVQDNEITSTWPIKIHGGVCLNLIGADSPNFDQPSDIYPGLIGRKFEAKLLHQYPKGSPQHETQFMGRMRMSLAASRVITREICRNGLAQEKVIWKGTTRTKVHATDPAYGGGDRCIAGWGEFGEASDGRIILRVTAPHPIKIDLKMKREDGQPVTPEDQIAEAVKRELEDHSIPPGNSFYDSFGKGTIGFAMAKAFGGVCPVPVNAGGPATDRPVRYDLFVDEPGGRRRLKKCNEEYANQITEFWFSTREAIEAQQIRELPTDVIEEGCSRQYTTVSGNRIQVEPKDEMRKNTGKSPDLYDWFAIMVEGARRLGFRISRLGVVHGSEIIAEGWLDKEREDFQETIKGIMLERAA